MKKAKKSKKAQDPEAHLYLTSGQAASHCHVSPPTIKAWVAAGRLKAFRTAGGHIRIRLGDFQRFLAANVIPPYRPSAAAEASPPPEPRILIVDDDPRWLVVLDETLRRDPRGFKLETATDGYEALVKVGSFQPSLLILDVAMPKIDGVEVCRTLKAAPTTRAIRILGLTGYADRVADLLAAGADGCLVKPVGLTRLLRELDRLLVSAGTELGVA